MNQLREINYMLNIIYHLTDKAKNDGSMELSMINQIHIMGDRVQKTKCSGLQNNAQRILLTWLRLHEGILLVNLCIEYVFNLPVDLLGFVLLNKNITIVGCQKRKRDLAYPQFFVLNQEERWDSRYYRPKIIDYRGYFWK